MLLKSETMKNTQPNTTNLRSLIDEKHRTDKRQKHTINNNNKQRQLKQLQQNQIAPADTATISAKEEEDKEQV